LACIFYGKAPKQDVSDSRKKQKSKEKSSFFEKASNYFSLLNLKPLIDRFGF
jgi:hypothetical protein